MEDLFDCVAENLSTFLKALKESARDFDWNGCAGILDVVREPSNVKSLSDDLLEAYGNIDVKEGTPYSIYHLLLKSILIIGCLLYLSIK